MATLNYTTSISPTKTVGEMQTLLARHGAQRIAVDYESGVPSALSFFLTTPHGARAFTLPVNVDAMHRLLKQQDREGKLRAGAKAIRSSREQAERVAWRVMKRQRWLGSIRSCSPYLHVDGDRTLYATYKEREQTAALEQ